MKNKKILIILSILLSILALGAVVAVTGNVPEDETYTVCIDYIIDGEDKPFKTVSEKYVAGSTANIVAPIKDGYKPRQASFVAIVNADYVLTVVYDCAHLPGMEKSVVLSYPTDTEDGVMEYTCENCGEFVHTTFTKLSRTITFGGAPLEDTIRSGAVTGYRVNTSDLVVTLKQTFAPEWKVFYDYGLLFGNNAWIPDNCDVSYEYDETIWGEGALGFTRAKQHPYSEPYRFRVAAGNTIAIMFESKLFVSGSALTEWANPETCPLVLAPIKVTLTYDWRK